MPKFSEKIKELRSKAEELLETQPKDVRESKESDLNHLIHELDVYQVDLQLQNEELQSAQSELKAKLAKYQELYDFSPIGIFTTNSKGLILDINLTACSYFGKGRAFLKNKPLTVYLSGESHDVYFSHMASAIKSGKKETCELTFISSKNLGSITFQTESIAYFEKGEYYIRSGIVDITEKKRTELIIKDRESLLRSLLDTSQNAILIFEIDGFSDSGIPNLVLWDANPKAFQLFPFFQIPKGISPKKLFMDNYRYMESFVEDIYHVASSGMNLVREARFPLPKKFSSFKVNIVKFMHGISITFTDITDEVETSSQKDQILAKIIESLPDQDVHVFNRSKIIVTSGGTFSQKLGYPINAWIGNTPSQMFSDGIGELLESLFEEALVDKVVQREFSIFGISVNAIALPIYNDGNEVDLGICIVRDISSERKKTKELEDEKASLESRIIERTKDLAKINQEYRRELNEKKALEKELVLSKQWESIGNLAAGIAHDFNNILQPITTYTTLSETLLNSFNLDSAIKLRTYLARIKLSCEKGKNIVQQVIDFSKSKEDQMDSIDLRIEVEEAIRNVLAHIPKNITIKRKLPDSAQYVLCYSSGIYQIAYNLIQNAIHAISKSPNPSLEILFQEVTIAEKFEIFGLEIEPGEYYEVCFLDNGIGISSSKHKQIFDAFYTEKENIGGTGLGLAIVHGILKRIKGGIRLLSEHGKGSNFQILLPKAMQSLDSKKKSDFVYSHQKNLVTGNFQTILLVDDDDLILAAQKEAFGMLGYKVFDYSSAEGALEFFQKHTSEIDILITDQKMQGMDGTELVYKAKALKPTLPTIICTGFSSLLNPNVQPEGVSKIFVKPIDMTELARSIAQLLKEVKKNEFTIKTQQS